MSRSLPKFESLSIRPASLMAFGPCSTPLLFCKIKSFFFTPMAEEHMEIIWIQSDSRTLNCVIFHTCPLEKGAPTTATDCARLWQLLVSCVLRRRNSGPLNAIFENVQYKRNKKSKCENRSRLQALQEFYSMRLYVHDAMTVLLGGWSYVLCVSFIFMSWWTAQTLARIFPLATSPPRYQNHVKQ